MKILAIAFFAIVLSGCAVNPSRTVRDGDRITSTGLSTIQNSTIKHDSGWTQFAVTAINGPGLSHALTDDPVPGLFPIEAGFNILTVCASDYTSSFPTITTQGAVGTITFYAANGTAYVLSGYLDGDQAVVWISERNTLRKITSDYVFPMGEKHVTRPQIPIILPISVK